MGNRPGRHGAERKYGCETLAVESREVAATIPWDEWMSLLLPDDMPLVHALLPGTHDSGTYAVQSHGFGPLDDASRTQHAGFDIDAQLYCGVRFFDLRIKSSGRIYHGPVRCKLSLHDILAEFTAFLQDRPGEFLVARVKHEQPSKKTAPRVAGLMAGLSEAFPFWCGRMLPTVAQLRGKIFLLQQWEGPELAMQWGCPAMRIQDEFKVSSPERKVQVVQEQLALSQKAREEVPLPLFVNFASATGLPYITPKTIASTVNPMLAEQFRHGVLPTGIIVMDFPSSDLCAAIALVNSTATKHMQAPRGSDFLAGLDAADSGAYTPKAIEAIYPQFQCKMEAPGSKAHLPGVPDAPPTFATECS